MRSHRETWEQETADLREERDRLKREVEEGNTNVRKEEVRRILSYQAICLVFTHNSFAVSDSQKFLTEYSHINIKNINNV